MADDVAPAGERGAALVTTLLVMMILLAITSTLVTMVTAQSRATGTQQRHQGSLHAAEAGAERIVARVKANAAYSTGQVLTVADAGNLRNWAETQCRTVTANQVSVPGGLACGFRPRDSANALVNYVLGVGTLGGRTRVVRLDVTAATGAAPTQAVLTGGNLFLQQGTIAGSLHTNGSLEVQNNLSVSGGSSTASGTYNAPNSPPVNPNGGARPAVTIPAFTAQGYYPQHTGYAGRWWDLCPDRTVRLPSGSTPCQGSTVAGVSPDELQFDTTLNRWLHNYNSGSWSTLNRVFYVHLGSIRFANNAVTGSATVLASASPSDGGTSGNIEFWNNGTISPVIPGVLLVADRDLHVRNELRASGFLGAGESFWIQSNLFLPQASGGGSLISRGLPDTANSLLRAAPGGTASTGCQQNVGNQICNVLELSYAPPPGLAASGAFTVSSWQEL